MDIKRCKAWDLCINKTFPLWCLMMHFWCSQPREAKLHTDKNLSSFSHSRQQGDSPHPTYWQFFLVLGHFSVCNFVFRMILLLGSLETSVGNNPKIWCMDWQNINADSCPESPWHNFNNFLAKALSAWTRPLLLSHAHTRMLPLALWLTLPMYHHRKTGHKRWILKATTEYAGKNQRFMPWGILMLL